jgi:hypothetical protein
VSESTVETIGSVGNRTDHLEPHVSNDCSITIAAECKLEKSNTVGTEGWVEELARVSSTHLPPSHPCLEYLKGHGFDLGTDDDLNRFTGNPSPLGGKRWYIAVSVKGKDAEFLVDTGASHSIISWKFFNLVSDEHDNLTVKVNAHTADGSRIRTFGRTFMRIRMGGKEFVFSPTIAEISDEGIIGLDFAYSANIMKVLSFYLLFHYLCLPYDVALQTTYSEKALVKIRAFLAILNIGANYVFYEMFGIMGIAISSILVKGSNFVLVLIKARLSIPYQK